MGPQAEAIFIVDNVLNALLLGYVIARAIILFQPFIIQKALYGFY